MITFPASIFTSLFSGKRTLGLSNKSTSIRRDFRLHFKSVDGNLQYLPIRPHGDFCKSRVFAASATCREGNSLTRADWQRIAEERLLAVQALLAAQAWPSAYYLAGYAVECGLKSCILSHVAANPELIFREKKFSEKCWTHEIAELVKLAGLEDSLKADRKAKQPLDENWMIVGRWTERSRYYKGRPPRIPLHVRGGVFGDREVDEAYLVKGPTGENTMASGREILDTIIDQEATFFQQHGKPPRKLKLPVLMAYDLAKCGRNELGDLSGRVFKDGISVFEKEGFHGMNVEIIRDRNASLEFE